MLGSQGGRKVGEGRTAVGRAGSWVDWGVGVPMGSWLNASSTFASSRHR